MGCSVATTCIHTQQLLNTYALYCTHQLATLQSRLLDVGSAVATPLGGSNAVKVAQVVFDAAATERLEVRSNLQCAAAGCVLQRLCCRRKKTL